VSRKIKSNMATIKEEMGIIRQIAMDLLCRLGGLKGRETGNMFDIDYSTVSVSKKRLRHKIQEDNDPKRLLSRIKENLSNIKN
jgi:chromosomal replication initiation ATPase DnaA